MYVKIDEEYPKKIAAIIAEHPDYTMKELAEAAGISKATIHRVYGTREHLLEMVCQETDRKLKEILNHMDKPQDDYEKWLDEIIHIHFTCIEYIQFQACGLNKTSCAYGEQYKIRMEIFFEEGKIRGLINNNYNTKYLTELFIASICGSFIYLRKEKLPIDVIEKEFGHFIKNAIGIHL